MTAYKYELEFFGNKIEVQLSKKYLSIEDRAYIFNNSGYFKKILPCGNEEGREHEKRWHFCISDSCVIKGFPFCMPQGSRFDIQCSTDFKAHSDEDGIYIITVSGIGDVVIEYKKVGKWRGEFSKFRIIEIINNFQ